MIVFGVPVEALWPAGLAVGLILLVGLLAVHELGPRGPWARRRHAAENLRDIALRAAERDPHSATGRTALGRPRDWSRDA